MGDKQTDCPILAWGPKSERDTGHVAWRDASFIQDFTHLGAVISPISEDSRTRSEISIIGCAVL